jgi:hypothetical protein
MKRQRLEEIREQQNAQAAYSEVRFAVIGLEIILIISYREFVTGGSCASSCVCAKSICFAGHKERESIAISAQAGRGFPAFRWYIFHENVRVPGVRHIRSAITGVMATPHSVSLVQEEET